MAVLERALGETSRDDFRICYERLEADFIASTWWVPETFPVAAARLEALDLDTLHCGFGSDLLLADATFYACRLATDREGAIGARTAGARLGRARRERRARLPVRRVLARQHRAASTRRSRPTTPRWIAAERRGDVVRAAPIRMFRARAKLLRGDVETALAELREAMEQIAALGIATAFPYAVSFLAEALLERGEPARPSRRSREAGLLDELPVSAHLFFFQYARGRMRIETGAVERGVDDLLVLGERTRIVLPFDNPLDYPWRRLRRRGPAAARPRGRGARVRRREPRARAALGRSVGARRRAAHERRRSAAAPRASEMLREAVEVLAGANARLEHARALVELGAALRRGNQRSEARELLREGVELAHRAGAPALVERGNEELAATGARPRKLVVSGLDSLTASERRVAEIAAQDLSNKEIAQALFVTVKTVEVHLSSVYRKLQIGSRRQLAPALAGGDARRRVAGFATANG